MKAYPFHKGHEFLIREALRQSERVTILLVKSFGERPSGELRREWVQKTFPQVTIHLVENLYLDDDDPKSSYFWAVYARDILNGDEIDVVFSSEAYGDEWAKQLGVAHKCVDINRTYLPISGTDIRANPHLYWSYMNEHARQFYLLKVLIVGPESTGKTTMCRNLALKYGTVYSPEYGRIYDEQTRKPKEEFDEARWRTIYAAILNEQPKLNARAEADARNVCFYDTDLLTTAMWYREWQEDYGFDGLYRSLRQAGKSQEFDLVIIMPLAEWVDDGYRGQTEDVRRKFYAQLLRDHADRPHKVLEGKTWEAKTSEAIKLINNLFDENGVTLPQP